jgi:hypothetical protein
MCHGSFELPQAHLDEREKLGTTAQMSRIHQASSNVVTQERARAMCHGALEKRENHAAPCLDEGRSEADISDFE